MDLSAEMVLAAEVDHRDSFGSSNQGESTNQIGISSQNSAVIWMDSGAELDSKS